MRPLAARDLLQVWEWGESRHPVDRALLLLSIACPERAWDELLALSIGQRDALLLALRELTFGSALDGFAECPACHEPIEFTVNAADLRQAVPGEPPDSPAALAAAGYEVRFRLPNSLDLAAIAHYDDVKIARDLLVQRCVVQARQGETDIAADALPQPVVAALATRMAEIEPLSEMQLDLRCPACEHRWPVLLDIVSFFWTEIVAQVKRLLNEVDALARTYGWREADILAMSARRRQLYLEMVA
jgi:hypothetical protein